MAKLNFPQGFLWGAATSAHQVEGGNRNNWSQWEEQNAQRLAAEAPKHWSGSSNWDQIKPQATDPNNYLSGRASDHHHLYEQDFDLAQSLGLTAYRFSIEWSRVEPGPGKFDRREIEHYRQVVEALKARGIEPFVSLWHWTIPLWLDGIGGWLNKTAASSFAGFAKLMANELPRVRFWLTLNEPYTYLYNSYAKGDWPPQKRNLAAALKVRHHLTLAHRQAYQAIKSVRPASQIGLAENIIYFEAHRNRLINRLVRTAVNRQANHFFLSRAHGYQDFIGLNHYFHNRIVAGKLNQNQNKVVSDLGWELFPEAIFHAAKEVSGYNLPIYVTENGVADAKDKRRAWFIIETLKHLHRAISEGADVRGYLHWSLLDNFEWDKGFWPRFGLIEVNYQTLERSVRSSAEVYAKIVKSNQIEVN